MPSTPIQIKNSPTTRAAVPCWVRNSASPAVGPWQGSSEPPHSTLNSEPESLIELRCSPFAGNARNSSPFVFASCSSSALWGPIVA